MRNAENEVTVVFAADGGYTRKVRTAEGVETARGTYRIDGNRLLVDEDGEKTTLNIRMPDAKTLEITDADGDGLRLVRQ